MRVPRRMIGILLVIFAGVAVWGFWREPASLVVREVHLQLPWPREQPLRVAVLSDLHVGSPYYGIGRLPDVVARTNATHPDIICLLGDFLTLGVVGGRFVPPEPIAATLGGLHAPDGVYAVLGNHDRANPGFGNRLRTALQNAGIRVLDDTALVAPTAGGPLWIAGVSDLWTGPHDVRRAMSPVQDDGVPLIVLTHNPDVFPSIPNRATLVLAGHTHGGQVRLPLIGPPIVPSSRRYAAGHVVEGGRHLFVTTGIGTSGLPIRIGVPPQIDVLILERSGP